jgi:hypothetical protein
MKLTRNQRRQLEKLAPHVDRVTATDRAFFEQHPDRLHRVRLTSQAEIAQLETEAGQLLQPPMGWCWFSIIRKVPGGRVRVFATNRQGAETGLDVPEDLANAVFETVAPPSARKAEAALRGRGRV